MWLFVKGILININKFIGINYNEDYCENEEIYIKDTLINVNNVISIIYDGYTTIYFAYINEKYKRYQIRFSTEEETKKEYEKIKNLLINEKENETKI